MSGVGPTVLIVDDDPEILECCALVLEGEGYQVATAVNGRKALGLIEGGLRPACTLLDLMMPVMDGWQFCDAVRAMPASAAMPIVIVSADNKAAEKLKRTVGVVGTLAKPFDLSELLNVVARVVASAA